MPNVLRTDAQEPVHLKETHIIFPYRKDFEKLREDINIGKCLRKKAGKLWLLWKCYFHCASSHTNLPVLSLASHVPFLSAQCQAVFLG